MLPIKYAELHTALFLGGTNLGLKLITSGLGRRTGLSLSYDRANKELLATFNNATAIIPTTNVASMVVGDSTEEASPTPPVLTHPGEVGAQLAQAQTEQRMQTQGISTPTSKNKNTPKVNSNPSASAQVSTPTSHVFQGPGLTGQEGNNK